MIISLNNYVYLIHLQKLNCDNELPEYPPY